ncbi:MAG: DbpA RNA binding domain-containing protein, partial [Marmoricola sp.]
KANRTALEPMAIPSVDDVNATRVERFTDAITEALGDPQVALFRDLIAAYETDHDVPASDIAAAIAVLAQDGKPLLLDPEPEPTHKPEKERRGPREDMVRWRINVGRKQGVEPRQIVGALANEGGLRRGDFGRIEIKSTFSLVELPDLSEDTLARLANTRIGGELIEIRADRGRPRAGGQQRGGDRYQKPRGQGGYGKPRRDDGPQAKKPRQKKRP